MIYENMPLYPGMRPPTDPDSCMKIRLFDDGHPGCAGHRPPPMRVCERVTIDNPCRRGERAEVALGVDECGNLVICVHRELCEPRPRRHDRDCRDCPKPWDPCKPWDWHHSCCGRDGYR